MLPHGLTGGLGTASETRWFADGHVCGQCVLCMCIAQPSGPALAPGEIPCLRKVQQQTKPLVTVRVIRGLTDLETITMSFHLGPHLGLWGFWVLSVAMWIFAQQSRLVLKPGVSSTSRKRQTLLFASLTRSVPVLRAEQALMFSKTSAPQPNRTRRSVAEGSEGRGESLAQQQH